MRKIPFAGIELTSQRVRGLRGTSELRGRPVSQSVEATIRQRRLLFAGALARQGDKRFPKRLLFAERLDEGKTRDPASRHSTGRNA